MARDDRKKILEALEAELKMPLLAWVTGDRENIPAQVGRDQVPLFPRHLAAIGEQDTIGLVLYTRGGDTNVPWTVVNFIRGYCKRFVVYAPFCAHSAGTLICLGADEVVMSRIATLSPIDPSVANAFNPEDPANPPNRIPIAVEDVLAYFELAKNQGVKSDQDLATAFQRLAESVHPLALGNVHRSIAQIQQLATKLIRLHSEDDSDEEVAERVKSLTTAFYTHHHLINREEARTLGLPIEDASSKVESLLMDYYEQLREDLELKSKFDPAKTFLQAAAQQQGVQPQPVTTERAYIETASTSDAFVTEGTVLMQPQVAPGGQQQPGPMVPTLQISVDEWREIE